MADDESADVPAKKVGRDPREPSIGVAAERLEKFCAAHGGTGPAFVEYVSSTRTRVVVVAADGTWGDAVLPDEEAAVAAVERAGLTRDEEWDRESSGALRPDPAGWKRMAGST